VAALAEANFDQLIYAIFTPPLRFSRQPVAFMKFSSSIVARVTENNRRPKQFFLLSLFAHTQSFPVSQMQQVA